MLGLVSSIVTFMAAYTCLDSVIPDLDSPDVIPESMKFVQDLDPHLVGEVEHLLGKNSDDDGDIGKQWRPLETRAITNDKNFTFYWQFSKAYGREIYKATTTFNYPKATVVDSFWTEHFFADGWGDEMFSETKMLGFAGANRFIIWQELDPVMPGWLMSTRDFVTYFAKFDKMDDKGSEQTIIVASNLTSYPQWTHPLRNGVVRAVSGVSGWRITQLQDSPALTRVEWLTNADQKAPSLIPRSAMRPIMARVISGIFRAWGEYMENQQSPVLI